METLQNNPVTIELIEKPRGSGKSASLKLKIIEEHNTEGVYPVILGKEFLSKEMRRYFDTYHSHIDILYRLDEIKEPIDRPIVVYIDECFLLSEEQLENIKDKVKALSFTYNIRIYGVGTKC